MPVTILHAYPAEFDGRSVMLRDELRGLGVDVPMVYAPHDGCRRFDEWVERVADVFVAQQPPGEPIRLLGYCIGGVLCMELAACLTERGLRPSYVGLVESWHPEPLTRLTDGTYRHFRVPWRARIRDSIFEVSRPHGTRARTVAAAWFVALLKWPPRWFRDVVVRRGVPRRRNSRWNTLHLAWPLARANLDVPVHAYNTAHSAALMHGDRTLGLAPHLRGGYVLRMIDGDHATCTDPPHLGDLARAIRADLEREHPGSEGSAR